MPYRLECIPPSLPTHWKMANSVHPWSPLTHPPARPVLRRMWRTFVARIMDVKRSVQMEGRFECAELFPLNSKLLAAVECVFYEHKMCSICPDCGRSRNELRMLWINIYKGTHQLTCRCRDVKKSAVFIFECLHLLSRRNWLLCTNHHVFKIM